MPRKHTKSGTFDDKENEAIHARILELTIELKRPLTVSEYIRHVVKKDLNGNAPVENIVPELVEDYEQKQTEDDKQDTEQDTNFWKGVTV